jgi:hypothetical protein
MEMTELSQSLGWHCEDTSDRIEASYERSRFHRIMERDFVIIENMTDSDKKHVIFKIDCYC